MNFLYQFVSGKIHHACRRPVQGKRRARRGDRDCWHPLPSQARLEAHSTERQPNPSGAALSKYTYETMLSGQSGICAKHASDTAAQRYGRA